MAALVSALVCEAIRKIESARHGAVRFLVAPPQRPFVNRLAIPQHQDNDARDAVLIDVLLQHGIQAFETLPRDAVHRGAAGFEVAR